MIKILIIPSEQQWKHNKYVINNQNDIIWQLKIGSVTKEITDLVDDFNIYSFPNDQILSVLNTVYSLEKDDTITGTVMQDRKFNPNKRKMADVYISFKKEI